MNIWASTRWKRRIPAGIVGYSNRYEVNYPSGLDRDLRASIGRFVSWCMDQYRFHLPIEVYVIDAPLICALDGDMVVGTCFLPYSFREPATIRIAVGDYNDLLADGRDNAIASILHALAHEITHYFQWINGVHLPSILCERQATRYADRILRAYSMTREHP